MVATLSEIIRLESGEAAQRIYLLEGLKEFPASNIILMVLRKCNPDAEPGSLCFRISVQGRTDKIPSFSGSEVEYFAQFEVVADTKQEALEFIREIEFTADPDSLSVIDAKSRPNRGFSKKGVLVAYPYITAEVAPQNFQGFGPSIGANWVN
jgi:hypothetical protein